MTCKVGVILAKLNASPWCWSWFGEVEEEMAKLKWIWRSWSGFGEVGVDLARLEWIWRGWSGFGEVEVEMARLKWRWRSWSGDGEVEVDLPKLKLICRSWSLFAEVEVDLPKLNLICWSWSGDAEVEVEMPKLKNLIWNPKRLCEILSAGGREKNLKEGSGGAWCRLLHHYDTNTNHHPLPEYHGIQKPRTKRTNHTPIASKIAGPEELVDIALHQLQVAGFESIETVNVSYPHGNVLCNARFADWPDWMM
jgi:hypothetical protein